ncbi:STAS domain-containing protein [Streptomyces sediminimaris]|uniref:STAS domain-containing protein n=1 Tax=Streptomyces sediminimaris TaxID=3383721 RepID=UPI00399A50B1
MTTLPPAHLRLTTVGLENGLRVEIDGDLDHETADRLLETVTEQLAGRPDLGHLRLNCARLGVTDSMGLSVLLMIRRRTAAAAVQLHLDDRPANLDRLLEVTGTLEYLTGAPTGTAPEPARTGVAAAPARPRGPDGTG